MIICQFQYTWCFKNSEATVDTPKSPVVLVVVDPAGAFRKHVKKKPSLSHRMHGMAYLPTFNFKINQMQVDLMVERCHVLFEEDLFAGAMWVSGRVLLLLRTSVHRLTCKLPLPWLQDGWWNCVQWCKWNQKCAHRICCSKTRKCLQTHN